MTRLILACLLLACVACSAALAAVSDPTRDVVAIHVQADAGASRGNRLLLPGGATRTVRAKVAFTLPATARDDRWVLWLAHDPFDRVRASGPGWAPPAIRFFAPDVAQGGLPVGAGFALPRGASGQQSLTIEVTGSVRGAPTLQVLTEQDVLRHAAREIAIAYAVYAGLLTLLMATLALYAAARDSMFLLYAGYTATGLLFMAAVNGHLYALPVAGAIGSLGERGLWFLMLVFNATALWMLLRFAGTRGSRHAFVRSLDYLLPPMALAAGLMLLPERVLAGYHQAVATASWMLALLAGVVAMLDGAQRAKPMAFATGCALVTLLAAAVANEAMSRALLEDSILTRHGFQFALVLMSVTLFVGLSSRIGAVRERLDHEAHARRVSEYRLRQARARSDLGQVLQERLRGLHPEEIATQAFHLLVEHVEGMLSGAQAVVLSQDYLGHDLLLVQDKGGPTPLAQAVLAARAVVRAQVRDGRPVHLRLEGDRASDNPHAPLHALVPVPVAAPAWAALVLRDPERETFDASDLEACVELAKLTALHAAEAHASIHLRRTAENDALTGTMNRRSLDQVLAREFAHSRAASVPLTVLFIDIDWFKRINDEHGHACGDQCLRSIANALRGELRPNDALARYGGEEFLVALPGQDAAASRIIAERLRQAVERNTIVWQGQPLTLTVSIGLASRRNGDVGVAEMLERADKALYAAKREGRNRVCVAPAVLA